MKILQHVLSLLLLLSSITAFAQSNYEIQSTTVSEKFDSENVLKSRRIWASGVRDKEVLNIDMVVDANNIVKELTINDKEIIPPRFSIFKGLTNYVIQYVDNEANSTPTSEQITREDEPAENEKLTESDQRGLMDLIKQELINDELIDNPKVFDFMLTYDSLYINAKKQEQTIFKKYKDLYEKYSDAPLARTAYFQITQTL